MSIIDFFTREKIADCDANPCALARARVNDALPADQFAETIRAQARARAVRSIIGGRPVEIAIKTALAWARCAVFDPQPPGAA